MSSLSNDDVQVLQSIGHDTVQTIVALVAETFLYTVYVVLVIVAGRILFQRRRSKTSMLTFTAVLLMLLLDTAMWLIDIHDAISEITLTLTSTSNLSLSDRYALTDNLPFPVETALYAFMSNLGDAIIIWRVYAFWSGRRERWVLILPLSLLLASIVTSALISTCVAKLGSDLDLGNFVNPPFCQNIQEASYATTLVTTAVATLLISFKTWKHRKTIGSSLSSSSTRTRVERVMIILIESGIIYFLFFLEGVISGTGNISEEEASTQGLEFAGTVWEYMTSHIVGIYPAIVVILVSMQQSYISAATQPTTIHPSSDHTSNSAGSNYWGNARGGSSRHIGDRVNFNVHELRVVQSDVSVDDELKSHSEVIDVSKPNTHLPPV